MTVRAYERALARLRAYERLLGVIDENLGPFPSLSDADPDAVMSIVEEALYAARKVDVTPSLSAAIDRAIASKGGE